MKLALVTGGLRRLGAAIAERLAQDGWTLALHSGHAGEPEALLAHALAQRESVWRGFVADLSDGAAVEALIPRVIAVFGQPPALLVNCAARFDDDDRDTANVASLLAQHAVNTAAPQALALALHRAGGEGCVVNIVDQRVRNPVPDQLSYSLSKAALAASTRTLAVALAPRVRVNAVAPGLTLPTNDYSSEQIARLGDIMPLGLLPSPEDIGDAVVYLAAARSVTGQTVFVDGGAHLRSYPRDFVHLERRDRGQGPSDSTTKA